MRIEWMPAVYYLLALTPLFVVVHFYCHRWPKNFWTALLQCFYRRLHFSETVPSDDVATIVVANHPNAFIDPFVLQAALGRPLIRTVRADWTEHWLMKWFIRVIGAIPLAPAQQSNGPSRNRGSFAQLNHALGHGKWVVIFPEGISHNRYKLRSFKRGTAHLAKQYMQATGRPIRILQLAVYYGDKSRLHSDVWVSIAAQTIYHPASDFDIASESEAWQTHIQSALPGKMRRVEQRQLNWLQNLFDTVASKPLPQATFKALPPNSQITQLHNWLTRSRVDPEVLIRHRQPGSLSFRLIAETCILVLGLPIALIGLVLNLPVAVAHYAVTRWQSSAEDKWASNAFVIGLLVYPAYWLALSFLLPVPLALTSLVSGFYALFFWRTVSGRMIVINTCLQSLNHPNSRLPTLTLVQQVISMLSQKM